MENQVNKPEDCQPSYAETLVEKSINALTRSEANQLRRLAYPRNATPVFDWNKALDTNPKDIDWEELSSYSRKWVSCACGNMCAIIPRDSTGCPTDYKLYALGVKFHGYINMQDKQGAKRTLKAIEQRSIELITDIYAKQHEQSITKPGS